MWLNLLRNSCRLPQKGISSHSRNSYQVENIYSNNTLTTRYFSSTPTAAMKFVQFTQGNNTGFGVLSEDGKTISDLSSQSSNLVNFISANGSSLDNLKDKVKGAATIASDKVKLISPITNPEKIICVGLNYRCHCEEQNKEPPKEPMFFSKFASTIVGPTDGVIAHSISDQIDWEVELVVVIGKTAKSVKRSEAMDYVFGYTVAQDISARDWQKMRNGGQFLIGKSMDTFCPLGPAVVHKSKIPDPHNLRIKCSINGVLKQDSTTSGLIFRIDDIIERLTQSITLKPGDIILTGTPAGVGMHRKPSEFLKVDDVIESEIQDLGKITNKVISS